MDNNDILKKIRYALDLKDPEMVSVFREAEVDMSRSWLSQFFKAEEDPEYQKLTDEMMLKFLDGLIIAKRGRKE